MSVVGIDLGNLNTVVAVARNRGIDVIVNETSNRATPSLVSFGEKQRYLGEGAKSLEISNFKNTVAALKRLIGRPFSDEEVLQFEKRFTNAALVASDNGETAASVLYQNEQKEFTFTQLVSMFLVKVKDFTSAEIKIPVTDCVISCPSWFTDMQRRALLDAAHIAGLTPLRIMNDTTASALGYGITKSDLPDPAEKQKPRIVAFVDLGHSSYQISIVSFVKGKLVVLSTAFDRNLGGRDFDQLIVDHYSKEFLTKYKIDIASNAKATFRLRQTAEKVKKILSANPVTMLNVECIMDDKDVSAQVQRSDFEEWAAPLIARLNGPLETALAKANLTPDQVDFVELVGGSTRIPAVKEIIAKMFGEGKICTTLNQDEAVARGCALQCAILSPVFKVRDFSLQDANQYPIELSWDAAQVPESADGEPKITQLDAFPVANQVPSSKILTFVRALKSEELAAGNGSVSMNVVADYKKGEISSSNFPKGMGCRIAEWTVKGIKKLAEEDTKAIIKVKAKLDGNGLLSLEGATQIEEVVVPVEEKKEAAAKKEESKEKEESPMDIEPKDAKTQTIIKRHKLEVLSRTASLSESILSAFIAAEGEMSASDRLVIDTAEKRNALEEYVYETRSKLEMAWSEYVVESERTEFIALLNATEDWLYGEGEEATKSVYVEKLQELKKIGDPISLRYTQVEERPFAEKSFKDYANSILIGLQAEDERYAHIDKEELAKVENQTRTKLDWLNDMIAKQNDLPKHAVPVLTSEKINVEKELLRLFVSPILSKPKPAPKKEEVKEEKKEEPVKEDAKMDTEPTKESDNTLAEEMEVD